MSCAGGAVINGESIPFNLSNILRISECILCKKWDSSSVSTATVGSGRSDRSDTLSGCEAASESSMLALTSTGEMVNRPIFGRSDASEGVTLPEAQQEATSERWSERPVSSARSVPAGPG